MVYIDMMLSQKNVTTRTKIWYHDLFKIILDMTFKLIFKKKPGVVERDALTRAAKTSSKQQNGYEFIKGIE